MTDAYLKLIVHFDNDDIYVNHRFGRFHVTINGEEELIHKDKVDEFIRIFTTENK